MTAAYPPNTSSTSALKQRTAWDNDLAAGGGDKSASSSVDSKSASAAASGRAQAWESAPMPVPPVRKVGAAVERTSEEVVSDDDSEGLDVISYWAMSAAGWLGLLTLPLLLFPRLLLFLSQSPSDEHISFYSSLGSTAGGRGSSAGGGGFRSARQGSHYDDLTSLERWMCTQMGIGLLAVAGMCLLVTPTPPRPTQLPPLSSTTSLPLSYSSIRPVDLRLPFSLILSTLLFFSAFFSYNSAITSEAIGGGLGIFVALGNGIIGLWGWWVAAFGVGAKYVSKKTGADKRTSGFPFKNRSSASEQKKEWRKSQR